MAWTSSRVPVAGAAGAALVAVAAVGAAATTVHAPQPMHPLSENTMEWIADWDGGNVFDDPWLERGSPDVRYEVDNGELRITGDVHRLYVRDPRGEKQWGDVEVTVYFKRVADDDIPYSGMTSVVRANHLETSGSAPCDTRGLSARLRNDGTVDFGKEVSHPKTVATGQQQVWPGGLPRDEWIGYKHIVYDTEDGVVQEVWVDTNEGRDGGDWELVASHVDDFLSPSWGAGESPCAAGVDPALPLTNDTYREGSESGKPNLAVYFRADGLWKNGLVYKWASVREITVE